MHSGNATGYSPSPYATGKGGPQAKEQFERSIKEAGALSGASQSLLNSSANAMIAAKGGKRMAAATRGVNCGTNARVNTFDNRGIQAQASNQ